MKYLILLIALSFGLALNAQDKMSKAEKKQQRKQKLLQLMKLWDKS